MQIEQTGSGRKLPFQSMAQRKVATTSKGHASGHLIFKRGETERIILVESDLEMKWAIILDADPSVQDLREQVAFQWSDSGRARTHYFDFVASFSQGSRIAFMVKPAWRAEKSAFKAEARAIAEQATRAGFADEVRVLTDRALSNANLNNARLFRSVREVDDEADSIAATVARNLFSPVKMSALIEEIGLGPRGFKALVRLVQRGALRQVCDGGIGLETLVSGGHVA
ncbi:hypothetical protein DEM26_14570 [Thioclava sp. NG1]|uniref:hypothetical protein n=1 Tax=Thioclava sp. NG1 TaxID=2182426 RepID=UPI000D60B708|nr:hypothetical protein [Thioclava sp. NG1]PWE49080.1 hypothetical protein DEM26_14570 [Thioclava sp. NG1]